MQRKRWSELEPSQRRRIKIVGSVQAALQAATLVDLWRRPADQVRGSKKAWFAAAFVQPIGPLAYWARGRRKGSSALA